MKRTLLCVGLAFVAAAIVASGPASANQSAFDMMKVDGGTALIKKVDIGGTSGGILQALGDMTIKKIEGVGDIIQQAASIGDQSIKDPFEGIQGNGAIDKAATGGLQARGNDDHLLKKSKDSATAWPVGGDDRSMTAATTMKQQPFGSDLGKRGRIDSDLSLAAITAPSTGAIGLTQADQQSDALPNIT